MQPYYMESKINEGEYEVNQLFKFIRDNAQKMDAYEAEFNIFSRVMKIGFIAMQAFFACVGTGDVGETLQADTGSTLKKEGQLRGKDYFSVFGKFKVPRTCYRQEGVAGVMPLDAIVNLPQRCYSYLLQEWMNLCSIRDSFDESNVTLSSLLGIEISQSRFEIVNREASTQYDEFYKEKDLPDPESEGQVQVLQFDGKGVPVIKAEAAKIKSRLGKGEKRQKKKEATVGVSFTVDLERRSPKQVAENLIYPEIAKKNVKMKTVKKLNLSNPIIFAEWQAWNVQEKLLWMKW